MLEFRRPDGTPRHRTVIIGRNGRCKTSVLRAIVLGLSPSSDANSLLNLPVGSYIGPFAKEARIAC